MNSDEQVLSMYVEEYGFDSHAFLKSLFLVGGDRKEGSTLSCRPMATANAMPGIATVKALHVGGVLHVPSDVLSPLYLRELRPVYFLAPSYL